jgi:hypothetical protein
MTAGDQYRVKAAEFFAMARNESQPHLQIEYATTAASYLKLAELADRNAMTDIVYEPPMQSRGAP